MVYVGTERFSTIFGCLALGLIVHAGCDDERERSAAQGAKAQIGVVAKSQAPEMVMIDHGPEHQMEFCYLEGDCEGAGLDPGYIGGEGTEMVLASSDLDRRVERVRIAFEIEGSGEVVIAVGEGKLEVEHVGDIPIKDFEFDRILDTSEPLRGDQVVRFEVDVSE